VQYGNQLAASTVCIQRLTCSDNSVSVSVSTTVLSVHNKKCVVVLVFFHYYQLYYYYYYYIIIINNIIIIIIIIIIITFFYKKEKYIVQQFCSVLRVSETWKRRSRGREVLKAIERPPGLGGN